MSKSEWERFKQDLSSKPELKIKLKAAKKAASKQAACDYALSAGYAVTIEDFKQPDSGD